MEIIIEKDKERKRLLKIKGQGTAYQEVTKSKISVDIYTVDKNAQIAMQNLQEGVQELIGILLDLGISRENIALGTVKSEPIYAEGFRAWFSTIKKVEFYELKQKVEIEFPFDAGLESKVLGKAGKVKCFYNTSVSHISAKRQSSISAIKSAINDAKLKAEVISRDLGIKLGKVYDVDYGNVPIRFREKLVVPSYRSKGDFFSPIEDMEVESQPDYLTGISCQPVEENDIVVVYWEILDE